MRNNTTQKNIPQGWTLKKLSDVLEYERPDNYIVKSTSYADNKKTPVLTANKSFVLGYTDEDFGIYEKIPCVIFDDFTTDSKYVDFPFKVKSSAIKILKCKDENADLKFIHERMKLINFPLGNHKRYYISQYQDLEILIPKSISEQQKIANILGVVDENIAKTQKVIKATEKLKKGLMQELFTRGIGHTKFKKSELGEIPDVWSISSLNKVACVIDSLHKTPEFINDGISMVRVSDIREGFLRLKNTLKVSEKVYKEFTAGYAPKKNDIVLSRVGSYGVSAYANTEERFCMGQNTVVINCSKINSAFLYYLLNSILVKKQIENEVAGSGYKSLSLKSIKNLQIIVPQKDEQQKISEILSAVDEKINVNKKLKLKLTKLKKGLMQDLLSGKVRVK